MLKGEKVALRALERDDLPRLWEFNNDVVVELAGGGPPPEPQSLARLQAMYESKLTQGWRDGMDFVIEADGRMIGMISLHTPNPVTRTTELGIAIGDQAYWGRGYGRDAIRVALDYAFRLRNLRRVWLTVHSSNERAVRAYRGCGFVEEGRLRQHVWGDGRYEDLIYMGILRDEWKSADQSV